MKYVNNCHAEITSFSAGSLTPLPCLSSTAVVGLLYPCIDSRLGEPHKFKREWASVMRCVAVFVGINHASAVSFSGCAVQSSFLRYTLKVSLLLMSTYHVTSHLNHLLPSMLFQSTLLSLLSATFIMVPGVLSVHFGKVHTRNTVDVFIQSFLRQHLLDPQSSPRECPLHFYLTSFHREDLVPVAQ